MKCSFLDVPTTGKFLFVSQNNSGITSSGKFLWPLLRWSKYSELWSHNPPPSHACHCHFTYPGNPSFFNLQWGHFRAWLCLIYYILVIWQDVWHLWANNEWMREPQAQQCPSDAEAPMLGKTSVLGTDYTSAGGAAFVPTHPGSFQTNH